MRLNVRSALSQMCEVKERERERRRENGVKMSRCVRGFEFRVNGSKKNE